MKGGVCSLNKVGGGGGRLRKVEESGSENGSVFLKQLDNLFGLGPLPKRCGNDGQPGQGEGARWRVKVVAEGRGAEQRKAGEGFFWGGCRLESQDLRLFWLDGSQMLLPSLQFLRRGQYTGAQLVVRDKWVSGCAEMGLL